MKKKYLSTYYFHGQDLCIVPRHIREDIAWMKGHGVDGVFVGVHDADLLGGNTALVCDCIKEAGLDLWLIPSRIGGLVAGWHRAPSVTSLEHPELWGRNADGTPRDVYGPQFSPFHRDTPKVMAGKVLSMINLFKPTGIVWDELKSLDGQDYSEAAKAALGGRTAEPKDMLRATVECFGSINERLRVDNPGLAIACFIYAHSTQNQIEACAAMPGLDQFGCDGKCFYSGECQSGEAGDDKVLLSGRDGLFEIAAHENGCDHFTLLETQLQDVTGLDLTMKRLPEFLEQKKDHLAYYYYPYGMEKPEKYMPLLGEALANWRRSTT